jgi:quercetin dioxygenase-like cupin family protein
MRAWIPALDTTATPWTPTPLPGVFGKMLNSDPETQARTGMAKFEKGAFVPGRAHYHHVDEEILVVHGGAMTFDHRTWLPPRGYIYHPPRTVHGFNSGFDGEVIMLSRHNGGGPLELNYIEGEPLQQDWYQAFGPPPPRPPAYIADFTGLESVAEGDGSTVTVLSRHPETGEGSLFLRLPPGWTGSGPAVELTRYREMFVLEGDARCADGNVLKADYYAFIPPGHAHGFQASETGALIYVAFGPDG